MGYRKDEMDTELKWGYNCYENCARLRRTMKTRRRRRYREVVIIPEAEPVGVGG